MIYLFEFQKNINVPKEVQFLLQLGEDFGLPINNNEKIVEFIKLIENNIVDRLKNIVNFVRSNIISILYRFQKDFPHLNFTEKLING